MFSFCSYLPADQIEKAEKEANGGTNDAWSGIFGEPKAVADNQVPLTIVRV